MGLLRTWTVATCALWLSLATCGGEATEGAAVPPGRGPVCSDCTPIGEFTYALPSPAGATLWTTTTMDKVLREAVPPENPGSEISLSAAKNEFESFQLVVNAASDGQVVLEMSAFSGPATIDRIEIRRVGYVRIDTPSDASSIPSGSVPDPLEPTRFGASEELTANNNQPFWITVYVPPDAPPGDYQANLTVKVDGQSQDVPISLHVYDFALPAKLSFDGSWNTSFSALGGSESLEKVEELKRFFYEHRIVPSSVAWPAGLNYSGGIEYDCASSKFLETDNAYDFSQLGPKYVSGEGWNGAGFQSLQVMRFVDNSTPRPAQFCGVDRGPDHYGTAAYNAEWSRLLTAIDTYLVDRGWQDIAHYYVQNEPQDAEDEALAAFLANLTKTAAPNLRIAISEEPKAAIAEHDNGKGHSYDLWWADLSAFEPEYAAKRQALGEQVWWYFLYGDRPPHFNPITIDHHGIESRIALWAAFKYRIRGFAYYSVTGWPSDPYNNFNAQGTGQNGDGFLLYPPTSDGQLVSSIRFELLREGIEDYEYLRLANGASVPATPGEASLCDVSVDSAVSSITSFTRDASALKHLRDQLGRYIEGGVNGCPELDSKPPGAHARAAYYLNFQDPNGMPNADPLSIGGKSWLKIGWQAYETKSGFGWSGPFIGDEAIMLYQYLDGAPVDETQRSVIFNDYGRTDTFNWDIENGRYKVAVSVGWHDKTYSKQRVVLEGQVVMDSIETTPAAPYRIEELTVDIKDGNVTLEIGQVDEYTMLNWLSIEPVD